MKRKWRNVPAECVTEISVVLPFRSSGYYDPGVRSGPPEHCYPPESDDERLPDGNGYLDLGADARIELTKEQTERLFDLLQKEVYDTELEPRED